MRIKDIKAQLLGLDPGAKVFRDANGNWVLVHSVGFSNLGVVPRIQALLQELQGGSCSCREMPEWEDE